jgi:hypothetical protein
MPDHQDGRLFINLTASQARKRLAFLGDSLKDIQSFGKNKVAIIHRASESQLDELKSQFADVGISSSEELCEPLKNLPEIGRENAALLRDVGIVTVEDLQKLAPIRAYQLVKRRHPATEISLLEALATGLSNFQKSVGWADKTDERGENAGTSI